MKRTGVVAAILAFLLIGLSLFLSDRYVLADNAYHSLSTSTPFVQNWSNIGLLIAANDWSGVPSINGYSDNVTDNVGADPQTQLIPSTTPNVSPNKDNPAAFSTGGVAEFDRTPTTDFVVGLQGLGTADFPNIDIRLNTTACSSPSNVVRVSYNLRDIDGSADNAVQQIALHYRVGNTGNYTNIPSAYVADATTGPNLATLITPISVGLPAAALGQSQVHLRIMTSNAVGIDEWVGIDDLNISCQTVVPPDTTPPSISYGVLTNTSSTANRVLSATISDSVTVASGAVLPRIYFRKNVGSYFSTPCAPTGGNSQSGTYDCAIDNLSIGGVTAGDVVGYFVIAQDTSGNITSNPIGAVAASVNSVSSAPLLPNTYTIVAQPPFAVNNGGEGTDASPGNGVCETGAGNNICTLRAAIMEANALAGSDIINFGGGITTINTATSLPVITTTMTIQGTGIVEVWGDTVNQVFNAASGGNLTLINLKVQNGRGMTGAGLQNVSGGTVTLTGCEFSFNIATGSGGGISNDGVITINSSSISSNRADITGGGIVNGPGASLTINDSNINNNDNDPSNGPSPEGLTNRGGGISNQGTVVINRSLIHGNVTLGSGGGIDNQLGTVTLTNTTVSFNRAVNGIGGGIWNGSSGTLNINNSTITGQNTAGADGGGVLNEGSSTANVRSSIIAGNSSPTSPDVFGTFASPSFNLVGKNDGSTGFTNGVNNNIVGTIAMPVDPLLGPLADNTGPTQTFAVLPNSPTLDNGKAFGSTNDQRGFARAYDNPSTLNAADGTDIGSFERTAPTAAEASLGGRIVNADGRGIRNIRVMISGGGLIEPRTALTGSFGYFTFEGLRVGETYVVTVSGKRYVFANPTRVVSLTDELADVDFVGQPR